MFGLDKYIIAGEDYKNNSIIFDKKFIDQDGEWVKKNKPSTETVLREFKTYHLEIKDDIDKGFVILSIEYLSPVLAYEWVNRMVSDINNTLRERDVTKAEASINYLETKLSETKITGLTEVFSSLLEEQYKTVMLANSTENYFFDVIDPAFISEYKSSPSRSIICVFFFITGFLFALIILFLKEPLNLKIKNSLLIFR